MRSFTRGRLVPRQPRAIKGTTRTELRGESIHGGKYIYWNINITPTALCGYSIQNGRCVHWNIGITPTALHHENIYIAKFIHWNNGTIPTRLRDETIVGVAWLIIKGEIVKGRQSLTPSPSPKREGSG